MLKSASILALASVVSFFGPCSKKDDAAGDAASQVDGAAATAVADAAPPAEEPVAKNAAKVGRFPSDTKLDLSKEKLQADATIARESPGGGPWVATLKKDVVVTKVAQHGDYILVAFADPKVATDTLEGWIPSSSFTATPASSVKPVGGKCAIKGQVYFAGAACKYECGPSIACPAGFGCTGLGSRPELGDGAYPYCEAIGGVVDAGAPAPISCKGNLVMHTDNKCHTKCTTTKDCGGKGTCTPIAGGVSACLP